MDPENQYFYGRNQAPPSMPQGQNFPVGDMDHSKMGPMMRALTEDFDLPAQNSTNYNQQAVPPNPMPVASEPQRMSNNYGPASQTLSGYASQYSSGPGSHNYFGHGHPTSPLNSGFPSPGANYPASGMGSPYQRQLSGSSPLGSPNGHNPSYPRSASAGPTIPSPIMMHGPSMYPHNQGSPANRSTTPYGFPTSPTSPHNQLNHASPPLASPSGMRPGGTLHSPKSLPASSPIPFGSQMSPTSSRAQSVPTLPGNSTDHMSAIPHARSKSPGSASIHRPYPQPPVQPQQLYPLPSPKVRPVDQTDSRGQYVELIHTKPSGDKWNHTDGRSNDRSRVNIARENVSQSGHLPRLEEMVAILGESNETKSSQQTDSGKDSPICESHTNGPQNDLKRTDSVNNCYQNNSEPAERRIQPCEQNSDKLRCGEISVKNTEKVDARNVNGLSVKGSVSVLRNDQDSNRDRTKMNGPSGNCNKDDSTFDLVPKDSPLSRVVKTYSGKINPNSGERTVMPRRHSLDSSSSTNVNENCSPFKSPTSAQLKWRQATMKSPIQTKDTPGRKSGETEEVEHSKVELTKVEHSKVEHSKGEHPKVEHPKVDPVEVSLERKCQTESQLDKHSLETEPGKCVPSTSKSNSSGMCDDVIKTESSPPQTPLNNPMTTPTSKRKSPDPTTTRTKKRRSPDDGSSSTGDDSLPLKKRRGRPPGSKNRPRKEGEEAKPRRSKKKKSVVGVDDETEMELSKFKHIKTTLKPKTDASAQNSRGPVLRVQGGSIESVISCRVVNMPGAEEEQVKGGKSKKKVIKQVKRQSVVVASPVGQAAVHATESPNPDGLWVCALCGNTSNFGLLGDLYGPYFPPGYQVPRSQRDDVLMGDSHSSRFQKEMQKRLGGGQGARHPRGSVNRGGRKPILVSKQAGQRQPGRWWQNKASSVAEASRMRQRRNRRKSQGEDEDSPDLWVHEECAIWAQGVYFLNGMLYGIHEAAKAAQSKKCTLCRDPGASIGCLSKGCKQVYHYLCATEADCLMHLDNYSMTCPKHKDKKVKMRDET